MHGPINVKSPNNTSKWQMGFNSAFKGLNVFGRAYYMHWREEKCTYVCSTGTLGLKILTRFMCDEIQNKRSHHKTRAHVSLD
jgi:hypothetical protein